jgi:hypothetical protein
MHGFIPLCSTDVPHKISTGIAAPGPQTCACGFEREILPEFFTGNSPVFPEAVHRLDIGLTNRAILLE